MYAVPIHRHAISSIFHHICWLNPLLFHVIPIGMSTLLSIFGHALTWDVFKLALFFCLFQDISFSFCTFLLCFFLICFAYIVYPLSLSLLNGVLFDPSLVLVHVVSQRMLDSNHHACIYCPYR
ncbi:hypothetical protein BDA99DRAFT_132057 [Phascolomyces articulosus]|uniref:Uncharacterized protein n=1 Tax=Phascolomyces articulosus TaxID=60185 RepID=A0AAD5PBT3_9FUNG|nr:hypothetical protein BDA99DRAFT_132057 [Phascolomyces articulosus]